MTCCYTVEYVETNGVYLRSANSLHIWEDVYLLDGEEVSVFCALGTDNVWVEKNHKKEC